MRHRRAVRTAIAFVATISIVAACGDSGDDEPSGSDVTTTDDTQSTSDKPEVTPPDQIPTELVVTVLIPGDGPEAVDGDTVVVDYVGVLSEDGTEFDNSYDRGSPFPVTLGTGGVIPGWEQGLQGAQAGSRIQLDIPGDLAYGEQGSGEVIGPNAALSFVIDVRAVLGSIDPADAPLDVELPAATDGDEVTVDDLIEGEGEAAALGQTAWLAYVAYDGEGNLLESSWESGRPLQFELDESGTAVPGLVTGVTGMKAGGRRIIVIPTDQAFGGSGNEQLGLEAGESLVMVIDLLAIT
jgi:FKBP-type peptidyl-prolyl cis-trans isomerase